MSSIRRFRLLPLIVALVLAWAASPAVASERTLDYSKGSFAGYVWFIYSADQAADSFAGVAIGRLPEARLEQAFGLRLVEGEMAAGALGVEKLQELRVDGRRILAVRVGPRHFDRLRHQIYMWGRKDHGGLAPERVCENLLDRVVREIGLKAPYRSILRGSDSVSFLRDLDRSNR